MTTEREQRVRAAIDVVIEAHVEVFAQSSRTAAIDKLVAIAMEPAADEAGLLRRLRELRARLAKEPKPRSDGLDHKAEASREFAMGSADMAWTVIYELDPLLAAGQAPGEKTT
jgi:hypothetical protein